MNARVPLAPIEMPTTWPRLFNVERFGQDIAREGVEILDARFLRQMKAWKFGAPLASPVMSANPTTTPSLLSAIAVFHAIPPRPPMSITRP